MGMDHIAAFRDAIEACGIAPPAKVKDDGKRHRFSSSGKPSDDAGWYILHGGEWPAGAFGCWRSGINERWQHCERTQFTEAERQVWRQRMAQLDVQRQAEREQARVQAALKAERLWALGRDATKAVHPYLVKKLIPGIGARVFKHMLLIPMRHDLTGLVGLQVIQLDGSRAFLKGTPADGAYMVLGTIRRGRAAILCEGYATGVSIHVATGHPVIVAFSSGNLSSVASRCMQVLNGVRLVVAADDDAFTTKGGNPWNPGLESAKGTGLECIQPVWRVPRGHSTDFNDLHADEGLDSVRACFRALNFTA